MQHHRHLPALLPLFCALALLLAAAGGCRRPPTIAAMDKDAVILAFGDSLTEGIGADRKHAYPAVLENLTGHRVVNGGRSGETTPQGLVRLQETVREIGPSLTILCEGGNDFLQGIPEAETAANLDRMIRFLKDNGSDVILVGVPRPSIPVRTASLYRSLAAQHGIPADNKILQVLLTTPSMKDDQLHLNERGYDALARAIAKIIELSQRRP